MPRVIRLIGLMLALLIVSMVVVPTQSQNGTLDNSTSSRLSLNIYLDEAGNALVTGYAENLGTLRFLNTSEYKYNNDTGQLFAHTNALTGKDGDLWTLRFTPLGYYDGYYAAFYLPSDVKLKKVNTSEGLGYLVSVYNESLLVEVQGYDIHDPAVAVEYQQPFAKAGENKNSAYNSAYIYLFMAMALIGLGLTFLIIKGRESSRSAGISQQADASKPIESAQLRGVVEPFENAPPESDHSPEVPPVQETSKSDVSAPNMQAALSEAQPVIGSTKSIETTSELEAVMETLTVRELAVLKALIDHGGRMIQSDLRYETGTPKSSLSGILLSLERRKLITKKEYGRTNVIELSERFLSKKEPS